MDSIPQKYVGIDIHKKFSQVAVMDACGEISDQRRLWHNDVEEMKTFFKGLGEDVSAAIEPTCGWMWMVDELEALGLALQLHRPRRASGSVDILPLQAQGKAEEELLVMRQKVPGTF